MLVGGVNWTWAAAEAFPLGARRAMASSTLTLNTAALVCYVLGGGNPVWALLGGGGSLLSWNAEEFLVRWIASPTEVQNRYLKRIGGVLGMGFAAGGSAVGLSLRMVSEAMRKRSGERTD
jgi:hypothetical protein